MSDEKSQRIPAAYHQAEIRFGKILHGNGVVGDAFKALCVKGCDPKWLQLNLFKLGRYPREKFEKQYKAKDFLKLKAIAAKVKKAAEELMTFGDLLFDESFSSVALQREFLDWERPVVIPKTLRQVADRLNQCSEWAKSSPRSFPNVYQRIPTVVDYVRTATGSPHYEELATLIGATLRDSNFNVEQLKMICSRRRSKAKK